MTEETKHPFSIHGSITGRFKCRNPTLQPERDGYARHAEHVLINSDYSEIERRIVFMHSRQSEKSQITRAMFEYDMTFQGSEPYSLIVDESHFPTNPLAWINEFIKTDPIARDVPQKPKNKTRYAAEFYVKHRQHGKGPKR